MKHKTVLITGATSGIGYETALALAAMGSQVVFTTRDAEKGARICQRIVGQTGNQQVFPMLCRLDDFRSIKEFSELFSSRFPALDVLINNAGIFETNRKESADGIELTFAVNHLAPFLLTHLLLPSLQKASPSRIINVSSKIYKNGRIHFEDPELKRSFSFLTAYSQSKLANLLFSSMLAEKLSPQGITVNCVHPGVVLTPIYKNMNPLLRLFFRTYMISPARGARTSIYLASSPEVQGVTGAYFINKKQKEILPQGKDGETASRLWDLSMNYVSRWLTGNPIENNYVK